MGFPRDQEKQWQRWKHKYRHTILGKTFVGTAHYAGAGVPKPTGLKALQRTSLGGLDSLKFQPQTEQKWKAAASHTPGSRAMTGPRGEMENGK